MDNPVIRRKGEAIEKQLGVHGAHARRRSPHQAGVSHGGQYSVSACLPVDMIGVYVLLPDAL